MIKEKETEFALEVKREEKISFLKKFNESYNDTPSNPGGNKRCSQCKKVCTGFDRMI